MSTDKKFMLEEYKQIVAAFFDLSKQKSDMFRFYFVVVTIPITLIAAIFSVGESPISISGLPALVVLVLFAVAIAGLIMTAIIVDIRFECILYAKTINLARRYFADRSPKSKLKDYLLLPTSDDLPRFYEQPWELKRRKWRWDLGVGSMFLQVVLNGLLNSTYFGLAAANSIEPSWVGLIGGIGFLLVHVLGYWYFATKKDVQWQPKKPQADIAS